MTPTPLEEIPRPGTPEHLWWRQGAADMDYFEHEGMTPDGQEFSEYIQTLAQQGRAPSEILPEAIRVFGPTRLADRLKLAWEVLKG